MVPARAGVEVSVISYGSYTVGCVSSERSSRDCGVIPIAYISMGHATLIFSLFLLWYVSARRKIKPRGQLLAIPRIPPTIPLPSAFPAGDLYFFVIPVIIVAQKHATVSHANTLCAFIAVPPCG